jgi:hypothetical protein
MDGIDAWEITEVRWLPGSEAKSLEEVPSIAEWLTAACRAER